MKTGIMTFHRVYNYGAVLQAYSTQMILDDLGIENEIIDFSMPKQRDFLALYSKRNGIKRFLKTILLLPFHQDRKRRVKKFDNFISKMRLSDKLYRDENELNETNKVYSRFVVGSDQVWNVTKRAEASDGYFLHFADEDKDKLSYASSIGNASYEELLCKQKYLCKFKYISCREKGGAEILSKIVGRDIPTVLDPTLLVNRRKLLQIAKCFNDEPYILYYSLDGYNKRNNNIDIVVKLSFKFGLKIKFITPEWPKHKIGEDVMDAGPEDFLGLINNAALVCTNSFHGTALSIKFNVPFYVLEDRETEDERKRNILEQLNLKERVISTVDEVRQIKNYKMNYEEVNLRLKKQIEFSCTYLKKIFEE